MGYTYTRKLFIVYLKYKNQLGMLHFTWPSCPRPHSSLFQHFCLINWDLYKIVLKGGSNTLKKILKKKKQLKIATTL
jgi:hypothetical protein